jgi:hypothetical protein
VVPQCDNGVDERLEQCHVIGSRVTVRVHADGACAHTIRQEQTRAHVEHTSARGTDNSARGTDRGTRTVMEAHTKGHKGSRAAKFQK